MLVGVAFVSGWRNLKGNSEDGEGVDVMAGEFAIDELACWSRFSFIKYCEGNISLSASN